MLESVSYGVDQRSALFVGLFQGSKIYKNCKAKVGHPMKKITELTAELAAPAIAEQGCTLWDVEYVKEAGTWYLRVLLDKEGGVDILDCEAVSRKLSDLLDEADPIEGS